MQWKHDMVETVDIIELSDIYLETYDSRNREISIFPAIKI